MDKDTAQDIEQLVDALTSTDDNVRSVAQAQLDSLLEEE